MLWHVCYKDSSLLCDVTLHKLTKQLQTQWRSKVPSPSGDCWTQQMNALCSLEKSLCSYQLTQCNTTEDLIFTTDMFLHFFLARQCLTTLFADIILLFTSWGLVLNWTRLWTTWLRDHGLISRRGKRFFFSPQHPFRLYDPTILLFNGYLDYFH